MATALIEKVDITNYEEHVQWLVDNLQDPLKKPRDAKALANFLSAELDRARLINRLSLISLMSGG